MLQMDSFNRDDPFPSWFANAVTKALSLIVFQFILVQTDNTHVQVPAGADDQATVLAIKGLWRWVEAPITVAHPGGAAGAYPIFATAKNNNVTNVPDPYTDHTDYSFGLVIEQPGQTPPIAPGAVDVYRHVGDAVWDGTKITRIDQWAPQTPLHAARHAAGGPDPLTPAQIGAVAAGDAHTLQTGDFVWSGATSRVGAVLCDGAAYSRTNPTYAPLFAKIGTRYGAGDGSTTFNVPGGRGRGLVMADPTGSLLSTAPALGAQLGVELYAITTAQLPAHGHPTFDPGHVHPPQHDGAPYLLEAPEATAYGLALGTNYMYLPLSTGAATTGIQVLNAGGGQAMSLMQPSLAANLFILL